MVRTAGPDLDQDNMANDLNGRLAKGADGIGERSLAAAVLAEVRRSRVTAALELLGRLKDNLYDSIPARQRQSRGITWVVEQAAGLLAEQCRSAEEIRALGSVLYTHLRPDDRLTGVPIFLVARFGLERPAEVLGFFAQAAESSDWVVREFAQGAFRGVLTPNRATVFPWLKQMARSESPNQRRFAAETLRPVTHLRWLRREPETSLEVLRLLFREPHPYPRTSVGNNLSDLSRSNPELVYSIAEHLAASGDRNSYWIAYRACRNLVKKDPERVMGILKTDAYRYKDRQFQRRDSAPGETRGVETSE